MSNDPSTPGDPSLSRDPGRSSDPHAVRSSPDPLLRAWSGFRIANALFDLSAPKVPAVPRETPAAPTRREPAVAPGGDRPLPPIPTQRLFAVSVAELTMAEVVERIILWSSAPPARIVITTNLDHVMKLRDDPLFARAYRDADLVTADGMPFVWLSRREGQPLAERVAGSDLIMPLARAAARAGRSVFLFGSTQERLHGAAKTLKRAAPKLEIRGAYAPPFGFERDPVLQREAAEIVRSAAADIVLVALGAPKQEIWSHGMANSVEKGVFVSIGGGLDFLSGEVKRAPRRVQALGLEWAWRALSEPRRLGSRYLRILAALPGLYRQHKADRAAFEADERRRGLAAMSDARFRGERERLRAAEADAAAIASAEEPLGRGPAPERDFNR